MEPLEKLSTGVESLDLILNGGIPKYSVNILGGPPGSGKTILAQQVVFQNATPEQKVPYLITTSEPTIKLLRYQQQFSYFDMSKINSGAVMYFNIADALSQGGLNQVAKVIRQYVEDYNPAILAIDSFKAIHDLVTEPSEIREFGYDLANLLSIGQCTTFLIGEYTHEDISNAPIFAIADGIIMMESERQGLQDIRHINVVKMRGDAYFRGRHPFSITRDGIEVFPRVTTPETPPRYFVGETNVSTGIEGLDAMADGGFPKNSVTLVAGGSGVGKTLVALHFIVEGARRGEPGLFVTFQETMDHLSGIAKRFGWDLEEMEKQKLLKVVYSSPVEMSVDQHTALIRNVAADLGAKRLVIDSLSDIEIATPDKIRFRDYVYSLVSHFRSQGITSILTTEIPELFGTLQLSSQGISFVSDNVILLRYVEMGSRLTRAISVLKMRGSDHDPMMREFEVTSEGVHILDAFEGVQGLMSGTPTMHERDGQFEKLLQDIK